MYLQYVIFAVVCVAGTTMVGLGIYGWLHRSAQGARSFIACMALSAWWMLALALTMVSPTRELASFCFGLSFLSVAGLPVTWLSLALEYTGRRSWLTPVRLLLLAAIPLLTQVFIWVGPLYGFWGLDIVIVREEPFWFMRLGETPPGSWFTVHAVYSYLLMGVGLFLVLRTALRSFRLYRAQALAMIVGMLAPVIATALTTFRLVAAWGGTMSAIGLTVAGLSFAWAIFRYRLFDLVPVARDRLIEGMEDGMLLLDDHGRIVDLNPAMSRLLNRPAGRIIGSPGGEVLRSWAELAERFGQGAGDWGEVDRFQDGEMRHYDLSVSQLADQQGRPAGQLLVVHDITARVRAERALQEEQERSERLLLNILPEPIARRLKAGEEPLADGFAQATVLFADIVNFTPLSEGLTPGEVVEMLNGLFSRFDDLVEQHGLEKVKTSGDAYIVVGGVPIAMPRHAQAVADLALAMQRELVRFNEERGRALEMRVGIHSGSVVAGVIGKTKFIYDLWGDTVNTASRMESHGLPGEIQVTEATYRLLRGEYILAERGLVEVKGKGALPTWFLRGKSA